MEEIKNVLILLFGGSGFVALILTIYGLGIRRRAHIVEVYQRVFDIVDTERVRDARLYVYKIENEREFKEQHWHDLDAVSASDDDLATWRLNKAKAELVMRSFDKLGLLVREGVVPIDLVARFYASPALRCWAALWPYVNELRSKHCRNQPGHMWEWENLVHEIIIPRLRRNKGVWYGVSQHDQLQELCKDLLDIREKRLIRDGEYNPGVYLWELHRNRLLRRLTSLNPFRSP